MNSGSDAQLVHPHETAPAPRSLTRVTIPAARSARTSQQASAALPTTIDAYLGVQDALKLYEAAAVLGVAQLTHRDVHRLGVPHCHREGPHELAETADVRGAIIGVRAFARWLEGMEAQ
jgi:hypothetical protein